MPKHGPKGDPHGLKAGKKAAAAAKKKKLAGKAGY